MYYSVQPKDRIFVKSYGLLFFAKNMGKNIGKNISKNLSDNILRDFFSMLNDLLQMYLKLLQKK